MAAVRGRPRAPLLAVDRTCVTVLICPLVPDGDIVFMQISNVGIALQEPEQFMNDRAQMAALRCHQRKAFLQIEAHLVAKNGERTGAGAVVFRRALVEHFFINSRYCFMIPQESCCCGRRRYAQIIIMAPATIIGMERICPMLMYCTHSPVNCASGWRKNSTMIRNAP